MTGDIEAVATALGASDVLVLQRGWPQPEFARFVADFMISALLPPTRKH